MEIRELCEVSYAIAAHHGFWREMEDEIEFTVHHKIYGDINIPTKGVNLPEKAMLIVSELCEMVEEMRKDMECTQKFEEELADVWIRLADFTGFLEVDIEKAIRAKIEKNKNRPIKHNKYF